VLLLLLALCASVASALSRPLPARYHNGLPSTARNRDDRSFPAALLAASRLAQRRAKAHKKEDKNGKAAAADRSFAAQATPAGLDTWTNDDGVKVSHYILPGSVDQTMYITDTTLIALSRGDIYATSNHGEAWTCWTCGSNFDGKLSGAVKRIFTQTDALSTDSLELKLRLQFNTQICVATANATYMISTLPEAPKGSPTEMFIAASTALKEFKSLAAGPVAFDALEFHPMQPNSKAFAFLSDPGCTGFGSTPCRSFAFYSDNLKDFYIVPVFEAILLMWENPVSPAITNFSVPPVQRHRNSFDLKDYNTDDFFVIVAKDLETPFGQLMRIHASESNWTTVTRDELTKKMVKVKDNVADARAIVGHEFVGGFNLDQRSAFFASSDNNFRTLTQLEFPKVVFNQGKEQDDGPETGYTVVDEREDTFINVYRGNRQHRQLWGHTYQSGLRGLRYTISLPYTRSSPNGAGAVDFHRVAGLDGILIANKITNPTDRACRGCGYDSCASHCHVETVLSRDNGKTWQTLVTRATVGENMNDPASEQLNLHGLASGLWNTPSILSSRHAPGLLLGVGNTGPRLTTGSGVVSDVFMSRDAGESWYKIAYGPHLYGESDLGALIFMIRQAVVSGTKGAHLNFSDDGGMTFLSTKILHDENPDELEFRWIGRPVHDPLARYAMLLALDGLGRVHVLRVDFTGDNSLGGRCKGLTTPDASDSDFESFTPRSYISEEAGTTCLLGSQTTYVRKKLGKNCYIDASKLRTTIDYSMPVKSAPCPCTYDDYECDFGYAEQPDGKCTDTDAPTPHDICVAANDGQDWAQLYTNAAKDMYLDTRGYRRIAGDRCENGVQYQVEPNPRWRPCPAGTVPAAEKGGHSGLVAFLLILLVVGLVAVLYRVNPRVRNAIDDGVAAVKPAVSGCVSSVKGLFSGSSRRRAFAALPTEEPEPGRATPPPTAVGNDDDTVEDV
jgi:hypothetical protein